MIQYHYGEWLRLELKKRGWRQTQFIEKAKELGYRFYPATFCLILQRALTPNLEKYNQINAVLSAYPEITENTESGDNNE